MSSPTGLRLARLAGHRRVVLGAGLAAVVGASWAWLLWMAHDMASMSMQATHPGLDAAAMHGMGIGWLFVMWVVMVGAMMVPTAAPMASIHARFQQGRQADRSPLPYTALFLGGYVLAWSGFAVLATGAQVGLERVAIMHPVAMKLTSVPVAAGVLIAAGLFQLTPLKDACLTQCRTPIGFFMGSWREGRGGALAMGLHHGAYCVGCCWALMAVMFVVGAMNMLWVAVLTGFMLIEKLGSKGSPVSRISGIGLILAGVVLVAA